MRNPLKHDRAFRVAFMLLVGMALAVLIAECSGQRPGESRVGWPTAEGGTKPP